MPADVTLNQSAKVARLRPTSPVRLARRVLWLAMRVAMPVVSVMLLWYLAIWLSGLPAFVIPLPERVLEVLWEERAFIFGHLLSTLQVAAIGFLWANVAGIGLAVLFDLLPPTRHMLMPAAITLRNVPYIALISVLMLAFGDSILSKTTIVALAGFFPVLINTMHGLRAADEVQLDRMRILNASWWQTFSQVRLPYALPSIVAAQEITGSGSIIVAIAAEWMISSTGLGYVINHAMQNYRGDKVYAVALLATALSFLIYSFVHALGKRLDWRAAGEQRRG
ncbi:MAG: ABC transporter permease [Alphaproteobacteria bacterium]|jgi:ABC-type nitrate/sulfonate/bicarbonate transport system permease component